MAFEVVQDLKGCYIVRIHDGNRITKEYKPMRKERAEIVANHLILKGYEYVIM